MFTLGIAFASITFIGMTILILEEVCQVRIF